MDVTFCEDRAYFPLAIFKGEFLPTNQVPWKTYYMRNLRKEAGFLTNQPPAPVRDSETYSRSRSNVVVRKNVEEKNSGDKTNVRTKTNNNEAKQGHIGKLDEYDPSLDILITLRKANLNSTIIPKNIHTALEYSEWKNAIMEEMKALEKNRIWNLLKPMLNFKTAFLDGDLVEEVYMSPLPGFEAQFGQQVCELQTSLYGLKQSPRAWFDRFTTFVKSQWYSQRHSDHTLFTKVSKIEKIVVLIVCVDDIVLTGDDQAEINQLRSKEGIFVSQRKYTLDLLTEIGMLGFRPADTH
ncbi:reverse transcriptase [Cucumis melo var. makuwa]|uniref:Reverse transcriptase n=1 Tax=Cucumis melo var. makuwa TaxID=1194695 RepID=A0A5D3E3P2_CUCMM|nr:reverse transcriptase [Cucumis melo var. makuwa]TYK30512.1 reverse transcriptase [Cucumis melo var. makuwa]